MAATPEAKVKKQVVKLLKDTGAYHFAPVQMGMGRSGIPDIIACYKGRFLGIECKAGKNKPTALQERELTCIGEAGGFALVINEHNLNELQRVLDLIDLRAGL